MPRILVDVSPVWGQPGSTPHDVSDAQRRIAIGVLRTHNLCGLPVVFDNQALYAVDPESALQWLLSPVNSGSPIPVEHAEVSEGEPQRSGSRFVGARRLARRSRSIVGGKLVRLAPKPAQAELRAALHHAERAIRLWLRPPPTSEPLTTGASENRPPLALRVYPGPADVLWTCGPSRGSPGMRWLAEVKQVCGFRVGSLCLGVDGVATIDQLDAADMIVCQSSAIREQLNQFALESGRPTPNARVLSVEFNLTTTSWIDELIGGVCEDFPEVGAMAR